MVGLLSFDHCQGMESQLDSTQPLTQPIFNPYRHNEADFEEEAEDLTDVIIFLHPASKEAIEAVRSTSLVYPQHMRYNANHPLTRDEIGTPVTPADDENGEVANGEAGDTQATQPHNISRTTRTDNALALRLSSTVHDPNMGFTFGRGDACDIRIRPNRKPVKVSNIHFRISVNDAGVVMLQDCSTNGTWVDNQILRTGQRHILGQGTTIEVVTWSNRDTNYTERASFTVTYPKFEDSLQKTRHRIKLETYLLEQARRRHGPNQNELPLAALPQIGRTIASDRDLSCGMNWTGAPTYSVQKRIGGGAFAIVYLLATRREGKLFAAKEILKKTMNNLELDVKISTEINIMKRVTHPHVVELVDWVDKGQYLYLIMEYMPCGDLGRFTSKSDALGEPRAQKVAKQVCHALQYIHSLNITHRDIKPDNILVLSWQPLWVKLSDFGLSKMIEGDPGTVAMRTFCGTMLYCAPEVFPDYSKLVNAPPAAATAARYDSKIDIWSLGSVFYQLLLHEPAFRSDRDVTAQAMPAHFVRVLLATKLKLDPTWQSISHAAADFLRICLQTIPTERPDARGCLEHEWLASVEDVTTDLPAPLDEQASNELSKSTQELLELTDVAEKLRATPAPSEIPTSQLESNSELDSAHLEAFLDYRKNSPIPDGELLDVPPATPRQPRQALFGEVVPAVQVDSGVFGHIEAPTIQNGTTASNGTLSAPADSHIDVDTMHSTVSNVQDLTISSPSAPSTSMLHAATSMPPPPQPSALKRQREDESPDSLLTTSKRLMAREASKPALEHVFGQLVPESGSIKEAETLVLRCPVAAWGRHPSLSHTWPRIDDTRIPKTGMDIIFWSSAMAERTAEKSIDWVNFDLSQQRDTLSSEILSGLECYLKTRSSLGISVNGVGLFRSPDKDWRVVELRNGDVVEIFEGAKGFLRYRCEIYVGLGKKARPIDHAPNVSVCPGLQGWSDRLMEANPKRSVVVR